MKKQFPVALLSLTIGMVASTIGHNFHSNTRKINPQPGDIMEDGGHYAFDIEPEIQGVFAHKFLTPSDNYYSTQKSYSMRILGDIESVWDDYTGKGTTVAIIDDGFDHDHPEYTRKDGTSAILSTSRYYYAYGSTARYLEYSADPTCIDEDWNSGESEWDTHGTNTSTTAAAPMGNGGVVGIAPEADILALKIDMSFAAIKGAISYAISQGVDVINMSLGAFAQSFTDGFNEQQSGSSSTATYLNEVCTQAYNAGIIVVAAAGNEATSYKSYPACNSHVIGVGALAKNSTTELAAFTNFNQSETQGDEKNVDILAPGFVYTAGITGKQNAHQTTYHATQGTSFSSPIVAGAACLWKQKNPSGTPSQFEDALTSTAAGIGTYKDAKVNPATYYGESSYKNNLDSNISCGRLDVGALMSLGSDVTSISISESAKTLYTSGSYSSSTSFELSANVIPGTAVNQNITWTTSNSGIAKLSKSSSVSGENITVSAGTTAGTATITATSQDGGLTATCTVTVVKYVPVTGFSIKDANGNTSGTIKRGETIQLVPLISPSNATNKEVIYIPEDESIASVNDDTGVVKGLKAGTTDIYALCGNEELEDVYTITVEAPQSGGTFKINFYDSSTLTETSSTNAWSFTDLKNGRIFVNDVANNDPVTDFTPSKGYKRRGGVVLGSSSSYGSVEFTISDDYKVISATVVGTFYDTDSKSGMKLNGTEGNGSLDVKETPIANCTNSVTWTDLGGITSLKFEPTAYRNTIYTIECEYEGSGTVTPTNYTVSFNSNGGSGTMVNTTTNGSEFTVPACTFTRTDYTFDKWALGSASGTQYSVGDTITGISSNITLYALWTENQSTGGGDSGEETSKIYTFTDKSWKPWTSLKDGNGFSNSGVQVTENTSGANANSKDSFSNVKKAIVTYCTNSSKGAGTVTVKIGNQTLGSFSPSSAGGTTARTSEITSTTALSGIANISVTCTTNSIYICGIEIFENTSGGDTPATQNYTVSFEANGGTGSMTNATTNGSSYTVPACTFTRTNYTFNKWALESASGTQYSVGETITGISSNITLFATWTENQSTGGDGGTYYDGITATSGTPLLGALHDLSVEKHTNYNSYSDISTTNCFKTDPYGTSNSYIRDFYSGGKMNNSIVPSGSNGWNREHLWCQSLSNGLWGESGGGADLQHLRPTVATINSDRGSKKYAAISGSKTESTYVDPDGKTMTGGYYTSTLFEPIDSKKGDVARILMYTYMHYNKAANIGGTKDGSTSSYFGTLNFTHVISATNEAAAKQLLLTWNESDPVDSTETIRNTEAAKITGCRNPFIDHPEYANAIWGTVTPTKTLSSIAVSNAKTSYTVGDSFVAPTVTATYSDNSSAPVTSATFSGYNMNSVGTQTVTVSYTEGGVTKTTTYQITVSAATVAVTGVSLDQTSLELSVGEDATLVATVTPSNATNKSVTWESNNSSVATVSNGKVTAISEGNATISVKTVDGNKTATCTVKVNSSGGSDDDTTSKYVIEFSTVTTDESTVLSSDGLLGFTKTNTLATSFSGITRAYKGRNGVKFGSGSGGGGFTINLADGATSNIKKLSVYSTEYDSVDKNISYSLGSIDGTFTAGEDFVKNFDNVSASTLSFATTKRAYISKIEIEVGTGSITPTTPEIKDISLDTTSKSIDLYGDSKTFSLTPTVTFVGDIDTTVTWSTSDSSVASISANTSANGVSITVTANKVGTATITATCGEQSATCVFTITDSTDAKTLVDLEITPNKTEVAFMDGDGKINVSTIVNAVYRDGHKETITPTQSNFEIDTTSLGNKEIFATYNGITKTAFIKVTNNGAEQKTSTSEGEKLSTGNITTQVFEDNGAQKIGDLSLTLNNDGGYYGSDPTKGQQVGSGSKPAKSMTLKTNVDGIISKVTINTSGASSVSATVSVTVGGVAFKCGGNESKSITTTATDYEFTGNSSGEIVITWSQTSSKALYFKSISVETAGLTTTNWTNEQQANAWADYFIKLTGGSTFDGPCKQATPEARRAALQNVWSEVSAEYGYMVNGSKDAFCDSSATGSIAEAMQHYRYIVDTYGLDDFVIDGSGNAPARLSNKNFLITNVNSATVVTAIIVMVGAMSVGAYFFYKKRKSDVE